MPRERENQINTLVLKDINFTINIIELSYYRTINILNQSNKCSRGIKRKPPKRKPPQAPPQEGMSLILLTCFRTIQTISNKDIPSFGGAWGGFFLGVGLYPATGPFSSLFSFSFGSEPGVRFFFFPFSSPFHSSHSISTSDSPRVETRPLPAPR